MSASQSYRPLARLLHWVTAILVLTTIPVAIAMLRPGIERPVQDALFVFHKNVGVLLLVLVALRLEYRLFNPAPPLPVTVRQPQRTIAALTHWALYALLLAMAVSGYIRVAAGGFPLEVLDNIGFPHFIPRSDALADAAKQAHAALRIPLIGLIAIHSGAAFYHGIVKRDGVFERMAPRKRGV